MKSKFGHIGKMTIFMFIIRSKLTSTSTTQKHLICTKVAEEEIEGI